VFEGCVEGANFTGRLRIEVEPGRNRSSREPSRVCIMRAYVILKKKTLQARTRSRTIICIRDRATTMYEYFARVGGCSYIYICTFGDGGYETRYR
jgi:hypothetical protein